MFDRVTQAIRDGETTIPMTVERPLAHTILGFPLRNYFINKVKEPFKKCIIFYAKRYPVPTETNCTSLWTKSLFKAFDKLIEYAGYNQSLFSAIRKIVIGEWEHDSLYRDPMLMMLESIIEDILDGEFPSRGENMPPDKYWKEHRPYGGKHTIIHRIIQKREAINDVLGRSNK